MATVNKISQYDYIVNRDKDWSGDYKKLFHNSDICLYHGSIDDEETESNLTDLAKEFPEDTNALICGVTGEKGGGGGIEEFFTDLERTFFIGYLLFICKDFASSFMKKLGEEFASKLANRIFRVRSKSKSDKKFLVTLIRENGDEITYIFPKHLTEQEISDALLRLKIHYQALSNERIYMKDFIYDTGKEEWLSF